MIADKMTRLIADNRQLAAELAALRAELAAMTAELSALRRFAGQMLEAHRPADGPGDVGGDLIQEIAIEGGLLESRLVTEPCGENCNCDDFPTFCYFLTPLGEQSVKAAGDA